MLYKSGTIPLRQCRIMFQQLRFRYKKKWAQNRKEKSHSEKALTYFDNYCKPVYGEKWPSIRVSLLSRQKYCALVNNFSDVEVTVNEIVSSGGNNMLEVASNTMSCDFTKERYSRVGKINKSENLKSQKKFSSEKSDHRETYENIPGVITEDSILHDFTPPTIVLSEKEEIEEEEREQGFYRPTELNTHVVPGTPLRLPEHLKVFVHEREGVELFPEIRNDSSGKLSHFMMDAASILPVIALDLGKDDQVLDLCSAPGGKALTILQTMLSGQLVCVDNSKSRLTRLKEIVHRYIPKSFATDSKLELLKWDGCAFGDSFAERPVFDKVLVDAPCYTDRHVLNNDDNNLFKPGRRGERLEIQGIQRNLLCSAMKAVKPGGSVVYSTCTLAMPQNDGTVQAAIEKLWHTTDIDVVVEDTSNIVDGFREIFDFYPYCRFGQLVLPNLTANCGPMYICKLKRLR